ncbi:dihydrodipicolinate synthase [Amycolatopsis keratiniphila]|uniref:4-hydroxy-tetrahydrodipicolinate synthase n=2 Tax=Amycolatopsis keratiniphila TaxID=129921 RepID=R4T7H7_9PSEU|nr:dihydrodipicolinate synthase [Amycolatopsis keratiniphila]
MTPFGSNLVAMVTPMEPGGALSEPGLTGLVDHLLNTGCDGIVVGGTTGESPTLTDTEAARLVHTVANHAGDRARVIAGVGTYDTTACIRRAKEAEAAGADALLLVCPYYSKPTQAGIVAHCQAVADATDLPVMLYDVPARTGTAMEAATLIELASHPRIRAVKDAKGDLFEAMTVMAHTPLAYYCGIDELNLPYLAAGATGLVSVVGNAVADRNAALIAAVRGGDLDTARIAQRRVASAGGGRHAHVAGGDHGQGRAGRTRRHPARDGAASAARIAAGAPAAPSRRLDVPRRRVAPRLIGRGMSGKGRS